MTEFLELPESAGDWLSFLHELAEQRIGSARDALATLKDGERRSAAEVVGLWNDADLGFGNAGCAVSLFAEVHPDEAVRTAAEDLQQQVVRETTERDLDRDLFEVWVATDPSELSGGEARLREHVLRDFRRSGVDRDEQTRQRLREIADRLTVLDQQFSRAIRDDVRSVKLRPEQLDGLPDDYRTAHQPGPDGLVTVTTDYPDYVPFRTFARDSGARRELTREFLNRAWPQNDDVLGEMLRLRDEKAKLLGYASWPDYDAELKMVGSAKGIGEFVDRVCAAAREYALRDRDVLLERRRRDDPSAQSLDAADTAYYAELVRREHFDVDAQQVRQYFDFSRVRAGLLDVTARLFGVEYRPRPDLPTWHEDVAVYDVAVDAELRGRIYLDLHPRDGKYKHAAQFDLRPGLVDRQLPEGALVCNFSRAVIEHSDVVTLFHEFGHLLHHILGGRQRLVRFTGVATEWDFVEAPSQLLEEWAWDPEVLRTFAVDAGGDPLPAELVSRMRAARDFGAGYFVTTQSFYAALSFRLHRDLPQDTTAMVRDLQARYDVFSYLPDTHFQAAFGHLAGYTSAYYTYLWSLVIAKDLFSAFDPDNLLDPQVAARYRDAILVPGGSSDAADLVQGFLGRPFAFDAFQAWLARAPRPLSQET